MFHTTRTIYRRGLLVLVAATLTAGGVHVGTGPTTRVHAAAAPTITATIQDNWNGLATVPPDLRYEVTQGPHYTLQVNGAHFEPGSRVWLALLRADTFQVLLRASTSAQRQRGMPSPRAGTFVYRATIGQGYQGVPLRLWSRSANHLSVDTVTRS